ncbi:Uncharacterized protein HZ326_12907 [Fusarium oxysporum f. sp. albedinis]|nr:Uncharacterized protein HZ326_12907 [Fusarium oxysporum f. sp. albedinis]
MSSCSRQVIHSTAEWKVLLFSEGTPRKLLLYRLMMLVLLGISEGHCQIRDLLRWYVYIRVVIPAYGRI